MGAWRRQIMCTGISKNLRLIEEELFHEKRLFVLVWNLIAYMASLRKDFFIISFFIAEHQNSKYDWNLKHLFLASERLPASKQDAIKVT